MNKITIIAKNMVNNNLKPCGNISDIAVTLLARDWKGVNNYGFNLIVEEYDSREHKR